MKNGLILVLSIVSLGVTLDNFANMKELVEVDKQYKTVLMEKNALEFELQNQKIKMLEVKSELNDKTFLFDMATNRIEQLNKELSLDQEEKYAV